MTQRPRIAAVLGPTNTGKTHYAIERMLAHRTGIIGLPLRLLAREVYDRIVALRGPSVVALVTGEERIVPERTQYWVCTVEAMPEGLGCDFLAVDEIQLCADLERGHVFTDRLLNARGLHETLFLGSDTMRGAIAAQVRGADFLRRERFSELAYTGARKISRMPPRSAIVGFSVDNVYAIAELLRRQKGGAAVVMGALSPRTRNAQVDLYQNGEVDYLVATDAIGMGLNLDIDHVAFSGLSKFDGRRMRPLTAQEIGQIAGRAGRFTRNGSFGVTGEAGPLDEVLAEAVTSHRFAPVTKLQWRNSDLRFGSLGALIASLEAQTHDEWLTRVRDADDLVALKTLAADAPVRARATDGPSVRLLWDVCRVPDFRGISHAEHATLLGRIYEFLHEAGEVPSGWFNTQVRRIDRTDGEIDTLSKRLAYIRTWTYVAQRAGWVADQDHWRAETRAVEDRLSDALHARLTQRFVDRRTSVLMRRLKQKEAMVAEVNDQGEVTVEGHVVGRLEGFRFRQDASATPEEARTLRQASLQALAPQFSLRADRFYNAPDTEFDFTEQGGLMWGSQAVGKLVAGADALKPQVQAFVDDEAGPEVAQKVARRLQHFIDRKVATLFEPLIAMSRDESMTGLARGFAFRMVEALGVLPREGVAEDVKALDQDARSVLRKHGIRFGQFTVFMPALLKPAPTRLRLVLWSLTRGLESFPESPPAGLVTLPTDTEAPEGYHAMAGYRVAGGRAIRIDMLERLADMLRGVDSRKGFEASPDMLSITGTTLEQFADLMQGLGYRAERAERPKVKPAPPAPAKAGTASEPAEPDKPGGAPSEAPPPAPTEVPGEAPAEAPPGQPSEMPEPPSEVPPSTPDEISNAAPAPGEGEGGSEQAAPVAPAAAPEPDAAGGAAAADAPPAPGANAEMPPAAETGTEPAGAAPGGPVETEVYFTFTWGQRPSGRGPRGPRRGQRAGVGEAAAAEAGDRPGSGKPRGKRPPKGGKGNKGPKHQHPRGEKPAREGARTYEARPPRKSDRIDPDNPFAAALMGLRDKT